MKNFAMISLLLLWGTSCSYEGKELQMDNWTDALSGEKTELKGGKLLVSEGQKYLYDGKGSEEGFSNFEWKASVLTTPGAYATIAFHTDQEGKG